MRLNIHKIKTVIIACAVLHNIAIIKNDTIPINNLEIQLPDDILEATHIIQNNQNNARIRLLNEYLFHL
jgi:hypothetical protein